MSRQDSVLATPILSRAGSLCRGPATCKVENTGHQSCWLLTFEGSRQTSQCHNETDDCCSRNATSDDHAGEPEGSLGLTAQLYQSLCRQACRGSGTLVADILWPWNVTASGKGCSPPFMLSSTSSHSLRSRNFTRSGSCRRTSRWAAAAQKQPQTPGQLLGRTLGCTFCCHCTPQLASMATASRRP